MPVNLLPEEMRGREEEEKKKVQQEETRGTMHQPSAQEPLPAPAPAPAPQPQPAMPAEPAAEEPPQKKQPPAAEVKRKKKKKPKMNLANFWRNIKSVFTVSRKKSEPKRERKSTISLMPASGLIIPRVIRDKFLVLIAGLTVTLLIFAVVHLYAGWYFEQKAYQVSRYLYRLDTVGVQVQSLMKTREEMVKTENKVVRAKNILDHHIYWTKFFALLEKYTINNVSYDNFRADTSGTITLSGSTKDLVSMARQMIAWQNAPDFIKSTNYPNVNLVPDGVHFSLNLELVDDVFYKLPQEEEQFEQPETE